MSPSPQPQPSPQSPPLSSPESAGSSAAADLEQLALEAERGGAAAPGAAPAPEPAASPEVPTSDFLAGMLAPAFDQLAPNWKVKPHEIKMLAVGWGAVLDKYFPGGVSSWGPWGVALAATAAVIGPRVNIPPQLPPPPKAEPASA
jgi:hypothetical protein